MINCDKYQRFYLHVHFILRNKNPVKIGLKVIIKQIGKFMIFSHYDNDLKFAVEMGYNLRKFFLISMNVLYEAAIYTMTFISDMYQPYK